MATLVALDPAPTATVGEVSITATEAARTSRGITATVIARSGRVLHSDEVKLGRPASRAAFAAHMETEHCLDRGQVEAALLELLAAVEGVSRESPRERLSGHRSAKQADVLVELADRAELFHSPRMDAFATVPVDSHRETHGVRTAGFRRWLANKYFELTGGAPSSQSLQDALAVIEARAIFAGGETPVFLRVAERAGEVIIDLGGPDWSAVVVTPTGWRLVPEPPVKFRRAGGMMSLPVPHRGGRVADLLPYVNVGSYDDFALLLGWLLSTFRESGPKPILVLNGEQGSAKSSTARVLRRLIDPSTCPLRAEPRDVRELMISAANGWVLSFDNLSYIHPWLSDAMCRLCTGGGFAVRELYTNGDEILFEARRPVVVNGIDDLATRSDLLDRAILLNLPQIADDRRRGEAELWAAFDGDYPLLFGALLDAVASGLSREPSIRLDRPPRLADFARIVVAAENGLGLANGQFLAAYALNRGTAHELAIEGSVVARWVRELVSASDFRGTATQLLDGLNRLARSEENVTRQKGWPRTAKTLSDILRRLNPNFRAIGIEVRFEREPDRHRTRVIAIRNTTRASYGERNGGAAPTQPPHPIGTRPRLRTRLAGH